MTATRRLSDSGWRRRCPDSRRGRPPASRSAWPRACSTHRHCLVPLPIHALSGARRPEPAPERLQYSPRRSHKMSLFECLCGKLHSSEAQLQMHMQSSGCFQFVGKNCPEPQSLAASQRSAENVQQRTNAEAKKARARTFFDERRDKVLIRLSRERYIRCTAADAVDSLKAAHIEANSMSLEYALGVISELKGRTMDDTLIEHLSSVLKVASLSRPPSPSLFLSCS